MLSTKLHLQSGKLFLFSIPLGAAPSTLQPLLPPIRLPRLTHPHCNSALDPCQKKQGSEWPEEGEVCLQPPLLPTAAEDNQEEKRHWTKCSANIEVLR